MTDVKNRINIIAPYVHEGLWVFDDEAKGLKREGLIAGIDLMLDEIMIKRGGKKFVIVFGDGPFPGHTMTLEKTYDAIDAEGKPYGTWYNCPQLDIEGWLCPALLEYYQQPPETIYVEVRDKNDRS